MEARKGRSSHCTPDPPSQRGPQRRRVGRLPYTGYPTPTDLPCTYPAPPAPVDLQGSRLPDSLPTSRRAR